MTVPFLGGGGGVILATGLISEFESGWEWPFDPLLPIIPFNFVVGSGIFGPRGTIWPAIAITAMG